MRIEYSDIKIIFDTVPISSLRLTTDVFRYIFNTDIVPNGGQVQDKSLTRQAMIALLHDFDDQLDFDLRLEICGASSAILNHGLNRSSRDIDVLRSSVPLTDPKIQEIISRVGLKHASLQGWLNDKSKIVLTQLTDNFKFDTSRVAGEKFKHIKPEVISKADFIITKLAYYDSIRTWDKIDLETIRFSENDVRRFYHKLDGIADEKQYAALMIEAHFKYIRPELIKTKEGFSYSSEHELAEYAQERYELKIKQSQLDEWRSAFEKAEVKPGKFIVQIDFTMAEKIKHGDQKTIKAEMAYRTKRSPEREVKHDPDL